jgi:hypothetical protein
MMKRETLAWARSRSAQGKICLSQMRSCCTYMNKQICCHTWSSAGSVCFLWFQIRSAEACRFSLQAGRRPIAQSDSWTLDRPKKNSQKSREHSYHHMAEREERNTVTISVGVYIQHTGRDNKLAGP